MNGLEKILRGRQDKTELGGLVITRTGLLRKGAEAPQLESRVRRLKRRNLVLGEQEPLQPRCLWRAECSPVRVRTVLAVHGQGLRVGRLRHVAEVVIRIFERTPISLTPAPREHSGQGIDGWSLQRATVAKRR